MISARAGLPVKSAMAKLGLHFPHAGAWTNVYMCFFYLPIEKHTVYHQFLGERSSHSNGVWRNEP